MRSSGFFLALILIYLVQIDHFLYAQTEEEAAELINRQEFAQAYERILQDSDYQTDPYLQYLLGLCYLFSDAAKSSALSSFNYAYDARENRGVQRVPGEVYYYLGISKHYAYDFGGAMNHFSEYKNFHERVYGTANQARYQHADFMEKLCQRAVDIINHNRLKNTIVRPLNFPLNSSYDDYYPTLPSISKQLVYASNRRSKLGVVNFGQGVVFLDGDMAPGPYHMFYGSKDSGQSWNIDRDFLSFGLPFVAPVSFSSDGQTLLVLMGVSEEQAALYLTNLKNGRWQDPEPLPSNINLPQSNIKGAAMVANGNRIYFSSNRPGGLGGYDIYITNRRNDNTWTEPENLGAPVNTAGNEITPYVTANMQELYFSSDQHDTMGYFDVFLSTKSGTAWTNPRNLGYPINSTFNDICYTRSADGVKEMLSSDREIFMNSDDAEREAGEFATEENSEMVFSRGNYDIYEITRFKEKMPLCIVSGQININKDGKEVPFFMQVKEFDQNYLQPFVFEPDTIGSKYFMVLRGETNYTMNLIYCYDSVRFNADINRPVYDTLYDFQFTVPKDTYHYEFNANIDLKTSFAFDQEIATHIKANSTDYATTPVENATIEKELEQIRFDALVLIMDRITALGKKEVLADVGSLENKIEYVQQEEAFDPDKMMDMLVEYTEQAIENTDLSYITGLTEVMRHKDGINVKPPEITLLEEAENIFNKRNKVNNESKRSFQEIADWVSQEVDGRLEFIYYGEPTDINAQERVETMRRLFNKLGIENSEKVDGYIDSNYGQVQRGKIKFILRKKG